MLRWLWLTDAERAIFEILIVERRSCWYFFEGMSEVENSTVSEERLRSRQSWYHHLSMEQHCGTCGIVGRNGCIVHSTTPTSRKGVISWFFNLNESFRVGVDFRMIRVRYYCCPSTVHSRYTDQLYSWYQPEQLTMVLNHSNGFCPLFWLVAIKLLCGRYTVTNRYIPSLYRKCPVYTKLLTASRDVRVENAVLLPICAVKFFSPLQFFIFSLSIHV